MMRIYSIDPLSNPFALKKNDKRSLNERCEALGSKGGGIGAHGVIFVIGSNLFEGKRVLKATEWNEDGKKEVSIACTISSILVEKNVTLCFARIYHWFEASTPTSE